MKVTIALAKSGGPERWDRLPYVSFDNAKEGKELVAEGKKSKKRGRKKKPNGLLDTPIKGAEMTTSDVKDTIRYP